MSMRLRLRRSMRCTNPVSTVVRVRSGLELRSIQPFMAEHGKALSPFASGLEADVFDQ